MTDDSDLERCEHVDFVSFPSGDVEYVRAELEDTVEEWQKAAEDKEEDFELPEAFCECLDDPTSFVMEVSWFGMPERLWAGFRLGATDEDEESEK